MAESSTARHTEVTSQHRQMEAASAARLAPRYQADPAFQEAKRHAEALKAQAGLAQARAGTITGKHRADALAVAGSFASAASEFETPRLILLCHALGVEEVLVILKEIRERHDETFHAIPRGECL